MHDLPGVFGVCATGAGGTGSTILGNTLDRSWDSLTDRDGVEWKIRITCLVVVVVVLLGSEILILIVELPTLSVLVDKRVTMS